MIVRAAGNTGPRAGWRSWLDTGPCPRVVSYHFIALQHAAPALRLRPRAECRVALRGGGS